MIPRFTLSLLAFVVLALLSTRPAEAETAATRCTFGLGAEGIAACDQFLAQSASLGDEPRAMAIFNRAVLRKDNGDAAGARRDLNESIRIRPLTQAHFLRGVIAMDAKNPAAALQDYDAALKLAPADADVLLNRALVLESLDRRPEALASLDTALKTSPGFAEGLNNRANLLEKMGFNDRAARDLARAGRLDANLARAYKAKQRTVFVRVPARLPLPVDLGPVAPGSQVALVIGNGRYAKVPALANPTRDAGSIADILTRLKFEVTVAYDLDQAGMTAALAAFRSKASKAEIAVVYFAGHGLQLARGNTGENHMLPVDFDPADPVSVDAQSITAGALLAALKGAETRILILDACRNDGTGQVAVSGRSVRRGLAPVRNTTEGDAGGGTLVVFSTAPNAVAADGGNDGSPFARALAQHLPTGGLEIKDVVTRVSRDVVRATGEAQIPFMSSSLLVPIYLAGR